MRGTSSVENFCLYGLRSMKCAAVGLALIANAEGQAPAVSPHGLVNAATGQSASSVPVAARGELVQIFGINLADAQLAATSAPLTTKLSGSETQVWFGGIAAPLLFVSPTQINAQVPFELPNASTVDLRVQTNTGISPPVRVTILTQDPGIFSVFRAGGQVAASNPVLPGETIIIWTTGLGAVMPAVKSGVAGPGDPLSVAGITPFVLIGDRLAEIQFVGLAPGTVGVYQINATVPSDLPEPTAEITIKPGLVPGIVGPPGA